MSAFKAYGEEKDPFDSLRKASATSEEGLSEEAMSPGSTWSNSTDSNSTSFSPLNAPMPNTTAPARRQVVKSKSFPTCDHEPRLPGVAPEELGRLLPVILPLDEQARTFRFQAPFVYATQSRDLPQYQLQQVFDRNDRTSKLNIRRILPHETRSCSVSFVYTARRRRIRYNEDSTLYTISDFDMKGRSEGALEGSIQLTTGKTLWGGQRTRIWHVTKCRALHHACNYRGDCEPKKRLLFCVKKSMWEDAEDSEFQLWPLSPRVIAMPLVTPSRLAIIIVSFSLITFFWTFGLPQQTAKPALPVIDHYDHKNVHTQPIIPPPVIETPHPAEQGDRPAESDDGRWDDKLAQGGKGKAPASTPTQTGVAEYEKDGGRWEDKDKQKGGKEPGKIQDTDPSAVPSTLSTKATSAGNAIKASPTSAIAAVPTQAVEQFCQNLSQSPHVMVVLKTSKADIEKLNTHLRTLISCVPTFAIFSDHEGEFEGHKVYNALESIGHDTKTAHDEFKEYQLMRADPGHTPDPTKTGKLDKWKMLPMVYKSYRMNPSARFFVFIEADTALSWTNLLQWVKRLDYRIPYYNGAPSFISGTQLAQRGPGIVISQGALRRYAKSYEESYNSKWEKDVGKECCGDLMLAKAMSEAHVEFYTSWPLLQGEQPSTLDYTKKHWCVPAISWHHISGEQLTLQWDIEKKWTSEKGWDTPYLYRDAYRDHVAPHIKTRTDGWDNLSQDTKIVAPEGRKQQLKEEAEKKKQEDEKKKQEDEEKNNEVAEDDSKPKEDEAKKPVEQNAPKAGGLHHDVPDVPDKNAIPPTSQDAPKEAKKPLEESHKDSILQEPGTKEPPTPQKREEKGKAKGKDQDKKDQDKKEPPNWDKLPEKFPNAADSPDACQKTCQDVEDCLQWRYSTQGEGECHLGKVIRLGGKDGEAKWTSGWLVDRIENVKRGWECKKAEWKFYQ
ncbi:glycosyltransferase family 31 protein [Stemphylium lycopersici]|nr:glycosyltransferase family 31 protein [Stemphylium lycopersici]